jgi:hypothetical protein
MVNERGEHEAVALLNDVRNSLLICEEEDTAHCGRDAFRTGLGSPYAVSDEDIAVYVQHSELRQHVGADHFSRQLNCLGYDHSTRVDPHIGVIAFPVTMCPLDQPGRCAVHASMQLCLMLMQHLFKV